MNAGGAVRARLADGRWHFQHGPIDLVIGVDGAPAAVGAALESAWMRFAGVLGELAGELALLRAPCAARAPTPHGPVARRMAQACLPYAARFGLFITPMAAVAGSVAQEIVACLARDGIRRAWVNNGGDIALWLTPGATLDIGVVADVDAPAIGATVRVGHGDAPRGIATSGWRGRSFSLGIADAVTVLAPSAAMADAAATMIANAVDVDHPAVRRAPASGLRDDSDLGERLVTVAVGALPPEAVDEALDRGEDFARRGIDEGLLEQAMLSLQGRSRVVAAHHAGALA